MDVGRIARSRRLSYLLYACQYWSKKRPKDARWILVQAVVAVVLCWTTQPNQRRIETRRIPTGWQLAMLLGRVRDGDVICGWMEDGEKGVRVGQESPKRESMRV